MKGHAAYWPKYFPKTAIQRNLAVLSRGWLIPEKGKRTPAPSSFDELAQVLFLCNYTLFTESILQVMHDYELQPSKAVQITCNKEHKPVAIRLKNTKNSTRWIVQADCWGMPANKKLLEALRTTYTICRVGTPHTPGGLGHALMLKCQKETIKDDPTGHHHHVVAPQACKVFFYNHGTGGRVDTRYLGELFDCIQQYDRRGAYLAELSHLPTGTACRVALRADSEADRRELDDAYETYFVACSVTIPWTLPLGPFPVRHDTGRKIEILYPTSPGIHEAYLWREEIEDAEKMGCEVTLTHGWAWEETTDDFKRYGFLVDALRRCAEELNRKDVATLIKIAGVSGLGRMGMDDYLRVLVSEEEAGPDDLQLNLGHRFTHYFLHQQTDPHAAHLVHMFNYLLSMARRTLFWAMLPYATSETLVMSDFDSFYVNEREPSLGHQYRGQLGGFRHVKTFGLDGKKFKPTGGRTYELV